MSRYTLFEGSPDIVQNDRTPLVNTEIAIDDGTVKGGGNVAANGPVDAIEKVEIYEETYDGTYVAGINNPRLTTHFSQHTLAPLTSRFLIWFSH